MIMNKFKRENPEAQNVTKVRITAQNEQDVEKVVVMLSASWKHHTIKRITPAAQLNGKHPEYTAYCIMLWN